MNVTAPIVSLVSAKVPGERSVLPVFFSNVERCCPECVVIGEAARGWGSISENC